MTRIKPITDRSQLPAERQQEWDEIMGTMGRIRGPFGVFLRAPKMATALLGNMFAAQDAAIVSDALHEVAILAVAREHNAPYQWTAHVGRAREAGLSDAAIEACRNNGGTDNLDQAERDVIDLTRELCRTNTVTQEKFDELRDRYREEWLLLVVATIGQYRYVATFNNAFDIDPLQGPDQLPV